MEKLLDRIRIQKSGRNLCAGRTPDRKVCLIRHDCHRAAHHVSVGWSRLHPLSKQVLRVVFRVTQAAGRNSPPSPERRRNAGRLCRFGAGICCLMCSLPGKMVSFWVIPLDHSSSEKQRKLPSTFAIETSPADSADSRPAANSGDYARFRRMTHFSTFVNFRLPPRITL